MYSLGITFLHLFCHVVNLSNRVCSTGRTTISAVSDSGFSVAFLVLSIFEGLFAVMYALIETLFDSVVAILLGEVGDEYEPRTVIYGETDLPPMNVLRCRDEQWIRFEDDEESTHEDARSFC